MSDDNKPFTVNDRRLFTREGEKREAEEATPPPAPPEAPPEAPPAASQAAPAGRGPAEADPPWPPEREPAPGDRQLDFVGLLVSLGAQAGALLMGNAGAGGETHGPDLAGARAFISLLEVLKEKTEGRRTAEEEEVLESLLYELRMGYVAVSRAGGA